MMTVALAALLGLPVAIYLNKRRGMRMIGALGCGALVVMVLMVVMGMIFDLN